VKRDARQYPAVGAVGTVAAFDGIIELLLGASLLFAPLAFGTTEAWSEEIVIALAAAMALCVALKCLCAPSVRFVWSWVYAPIALFAVVVLVQLLPMPAGTIQKLSPGTAQLRSELLSDTQNPAKVLDHQTISLYPPATRRELGLLLAVGTVLVVVVNVFRDRARVQRLLLWISLVGLLLALFALYQNVSGSKEIYAGVEAVQPDSGPFMCHNHFGQFMNLCFGAGLGLLITRLYQVHRDSNDMRQFTEELRDPRSWDIWLLGATCILCPVAMALSLTRGGILSLLAAAVVTGLMLVWRSKLSGQGSLIVTLLVLSFSCLFYFGFDAVYDRLATLRHAQNADEGRWQMLKDMTAEFRQFPLLGTGLGTHEYVFQMFDHSTIPRIATHAEDEYAQVLEECGGVGLALVAAFVLMIATSYVRTVWRLESSIEYTAFGLGCGLLAILFQSAFDFGQHLPANALLTAAFSGLLINLASGQLARKPSPKLFPVAVDWPLRIPLRIAGAVAVICVGTSVLLGADCARSAEVQWNQAYAYQQALEQADWRTTNQTYLALLTPAVAAAKLAPDNIKYRYWLDVYRWHSISQLVDSSRHGVVLNPMQVNFASRIADDLESCRSLCPTFGPVLCTAGQIELFVLHQNRGKDHIELARRLTPYDQGVCFVTGALEVSEGQWDASLATFRRCIALGQSPGAIIRIYCNANRPDMAYEIARGNRQALSDLAALLEQDKQQAQLAAQCRAELLAMLESDEQSGSASPDEIAELAAARANQGDTADAIRLYNQALSANYSQVDWRLRLANLLVESGQKSEALREARICLHLQPQSSSAQKLMGSLLVATGDADGALDADTVRAVAGYVH
jgi:tetratricopeptide (TPR) repeat protein